MIESAIVGMVSGGLPKILDIWSKRQDNIQELNILKFQADAEARSREIEAEAGVATERIRLDMSETESYEKNYAAALQHDTAQTRYPTKTWFGGVLMDIIAAWRAAMRPGIATTLMLMYCGVKICQGLSAYEIAGGVNPNFYSEVILLWTVQDWNILVMAISFYFTNRAVEKRENRHT